MKNLLSQSGKELKLSGLLALAAFERGFYRTTEMVLEDMDSPPLSRTI
jgi:hypothetical protein